MGKIIYSLLFCATLFVASCSKDDDNTLFVDPSEIVGDYLYNASVKVSGAAYDMTEGEKIMVSGEDRNSMTIAIPAKMVPGEGALAFSNVVISGNTFSGSTSDSERAINISGNFSGGHLTLLINPEYKSNLVGVWNFEQPNMVEVDGADEDISNVMICNVETVTGKVQFFGSEQEATYMNVFFNDLVGQMMLRTYYEEENADGTINSIYNGALRNVTFHADGNLTAEYNATFSPNFGAGSALPAVYVKSPMGAMRWYVKGGKIHLVPNLNMMTKGISRDGLALNIIMNNDKITVYADQSSIAPLLSLLNPVLQGLPEDVLGQFSAIAKTLVGELTVIAQEATRFDFGVCFEKRAIK